MHRPPEPSAVPVVPDHQLIRRIGEGSYGQIWLARNIVGTYRAVKVVYRASFQDDRPYEREFTGIQKFEPISRTHPGLVDILQIGRNDEAGYFYYVMEVADDEVAGVDFHPDGYRAKTLQGVWNALGRIPSIETVHIGMNLAAALAHMHRHGLVHRDVKPSNIIFVQGQPKLADIGLVVQFSDARTFVGTEGYIPPEGPGTVQADIFGLGKVLYEISTGQDRQLFPELPADLSKFPDRERVVELNEIVVKACANSPGTRYESAEEMRGDLELLLAGRSVKQLRFVERQLARTARLAVMATILAVGAGLLAFALNQVRQREKRLLAESIAIRGIARLEEGNLHASLPLFAEALRLESRDPAAAAAHRLRIGSALHRSPRLLQFWRHDLAVKDICFSPDGKTLAVAAGPSVHLMDPRTGHERLAITNHHVIETTRFSPDGARLVVATGPNLRVYDVESGMEVWRAETHGTIHSAEFSPDGLRVAVACQDSCAHLYEGQTGAPLGDFRAHEAQVNYASFSPDSSRLVTASQDGTARIWDIGTREIRHILPHSEGVWDAAFSPDGKKVVTAGGDHNVRVWDASSGLATSARMQHRGQIRRARFSPDGRWVVSAGLDRTVRIWDAQNGASVFATLNLHSPALHAVFSPDGRRVATASQRGEIQLWDVAPNLPVVVGKGFVTGNGRRYITYASNSFSVWNARDDSLVSGPHRAAGPIFQIHGDANGETIALMSHAPASSAFTIQLYARGSNALTLEAPSTLPKGLVSPDGQCLLRFGNGASVWDTRSGRVKYAGRERVHDAAFSVDGRLLALALESQVTMVDLATGRELFSTPPEKRAIRSVRFSSDSGRLAIAITNDQFNVGIARVFDARNGSMVSTVTQQTDSISLVIASGRGDFIATAGEESIVGIWDISSAKARIDPINQVWPVRFLSLSADDRLLAVTTTLETQVFEVRTGRAVIPVVRTPDIASEGGFCADGKRLWIQTGRGLVFSELPLASQSPDSVIALAHHYGVAIPGALRWSPNALPIAALREHCHEERARHDRTMVAWHLERTSAAELDEDWFAARFHLQQLLQKEPHNAEWQARYEKIPALAEPRAALP